MGEMRVMGVEGDVRQIWNPDNPDEVNAVKRVWDDLVGKRKFTAFRVNTDNGEKDDRLRHWDPSVAKMILVPPMAGG